MKATEFCYWIQGFFEIHGGVPDAGLTKAQAVMIQRHLHLVFKHEIDPSYPDGPALDAIHNPPPTTSTGTQTWAPDPNPIIRC